LVNEMMVAGDDPIQPIQVVLSMMHTAKLVKGK